MLFQNDTLIPLSCIQSSINTPAISHNIPTDTDNRETAATYWLILKGCNHVSLQSSVLY